MIKKKESNGHDDGLLHFIKYTSTFTATMLCEVYASFPFKTAEIYRHVLNALENIPV